MKDKAVLSFFNAALEECRDNVKVLREQVKGMQERYLCTPHEKGKREFNVLVPYTKPKTKRAVNIIKATLLKAPDYLDFETPVRSVNDPRYLKDLQRCNYTKRLVKAHLDAKPCQFIPRFCESLEAALGYAKVMVLKFWVGYHDLEYVDAVAGEFVKDRRLALKCKPIDTQWFDFSADRSIQIEHEFVTMPDLWDLVDQGFYEEKRVAKVANGDYGKDVGQDRKEALKRLGLDDTSNAYRKEVMLSHYWGNLIDSDNRIVEKHIRFTVANEQYMLTPVQDNPNADNSTPYVFDSVLKVPFRHIGKSLTEDVVSIEDAINAFVNIQCDNLLWKMLGVNEVDSMALDPKLKEDLTSLYPGKMIIRRSGLEKLAFTHHELGSDPNQAMPVLQELKALADSDHGVTEFISAAAASNDISAAEQTQKRADAMAQFEGFATDLESGLFSRCIDKARDLIVQYMADPLTDPTAADIIGQEGLELEMMTEEERKEMIVSEYNIKARGLSIYFDRMKKQNLYTGIYKIAGALPDEAKAELNWRAITKNWFIALGMDNPDEAYKPIEQVQQEQQQRAQQQQQMMQMEIQKVMAPLQAKIKQTEMGIQERMQVARERMQLEMEQARMKLEQDMRSNMTKGMMDDKKTTAKIRADFEKELLRIKADSEKQMRDLVNAERDRRNELEKTLMQIKSDMAQSESKQLMEMYKTVANEKTAEANKPPPAPAPQPVSVNLTLKPPKGGRKTAKKTGEGQWLLEETED